MTNLIKLETPELTALEPSKAQQIKAAFEPMVEMLTGFEENYNAILAEAKQGITPEVSAKAKRARLDIGKVRIETGKRKDKQKEYLKLEDKAIMGVHNILVWAVTEKEDKLKEIEDHAATIERERLEALQAERVAKLSEYLEDAHERDLRTMESDVWDAYFAAKKKEYEDRIAAEKKAEADRIAKEKEEEKERERIRLENLQLKKEAEERERLAKIEAEKRAKLEAERIKKEQAERKAAEQKAAKERAEHEAQMKAEREQREKAEAELQAKAEAERKAAEQAEAAKQAELNKGDADKVNDLILDLKNLKTKYQFKSEKNKKKYQGVGELIDKVVNYINL